MIFTKNKWSFVCCPVLFAAWLIASNQALGNGVGLEDLYGSKIRSAPDGAPLLTVGLMDGKSKVRITCTSRFRVESLAGNGVNLEPGTTVEVRVIESEPARVRTWIEVGSAGPTQVDFVRSTLARWRKAGYKPRAYLRGGLLDFKGGKLDTRSFSVVLEAFWSTNEAAKAVADLYRKKGIKATLFQELVDLPEGRVGVREVVAPAADLLQAFGGVRFSPIGGVPITVLSVEYGKGYAWHGYQDRSFRGAIAVVLDRRGKLAVVNEVSLEDWLKGTVPSEIFPHAPMEALKAQAIAARSEAVAKLATRHLADPYMMCAAQHCQVYGGVTKERPTTSKAVEMTKGMVLTNRSGKVLDAVYSAVSGGFTENNDAVWPSAPHENLRGRPDGQVSDPAWKPFLRGLDEKNLKRFLAEPPPTYEAGSKFLRPGTFRWTKRLTDQELDSLVSAKFDVGHVRKLKALERGVSGRIVLLEISGEKGTVVIQRELPIRRLFGGLKSGMFIVEHKADDTGRYWLFTGGGWGHGVGMSQIGAIGRAEAGQDFRTILRHYFNGAGLQRLYGPGSE